MKAEFDGDTYSPSDYPRLSTQLAAVHWRMANGEWYTIPQLQGACYHCTGRYATPQSISARIRDLRKEKFGGLNVEHEHIGGGLWKYRVIKEVGESADRGA